MVVTAMAVGMIPIALGLGEGGEQAAPLGRAVIGGIIPATLATMLVLPAIYSVFHLLRLPAARLRPSAVTRSR
jgi:multidrug efflux pump subunit AcrB